MNEENLEHARMMSKSLIKRTMTDIQSRIQRNTDQIILKSSTTLQQYKSIQMKDGLMKNRERNNIVMIKLVDSMKKNPMIIKNLHATGKITDTKMIIVIRINPDTKKTTEMTPNTGMNLVIELIIETRNH